MFKRWFALSTALVIFVTPCSLADLRRLSDVELGNLTAQNGAMVNSLGQIPFAQSIYIERAQLEKLYVTHNNLTDRTLYFRDTNNALLTDGDRLAEQIEMSLISLSTQLASTVTMASLLPLFGFPIGVGLSSAPDAFNITISDVYIDVNMTIDVRE